MDADLLMQALLLMAEERALTAGAAEAGAAGVGASQQAAEDQP
jgi:hypothetical protein